MPYVLLRACQQKTEDGKYIDSLPGDPVVYPESWPKKEVWEKSGHIKEITVAQMKKIQSGVQKGNDAVKEAAAAKEAAEKKGEVSTARTPTAAEQLAYRLALLRKP